MSSRDDPNALPSEVDSPTTAGLLRAMEQRARESRETSTRFFGAQGPMLVAAAKSIADVYRQEGRLFCMGNGGASCDAAHVAAEFVRPVHAGRPALAALNLSADMATISAIGNTVGFDHVFSHQIGAQARRGDGLIGFSTSGNSANLIAAYAKAKEIGLVTIGFSGGDGGEMYSSGVVDHCLTVPSLSVHRIRECHVVAYQILWDLVHTILADDRAAAFAGAASL